jgi:hypothetical protein
LDKWNLRVLRSLPSLWDRFELWKCSTLQRLGEGLFENAYQGRGE